MRHDRIEPNHADTPIPRLSDEEIEARVFRNLEARQKALEEQQHSSTIVLQYPETRTVSQRFLAWLQARFQRPNSNADDEQMLEGAEPEWKGHWATVKYL